MKKTLLFSLLILLSLTVDAHQGQTNLKGCHKDKRTNHYHCHGRQSSNMTSCGTSRIRDCNNNCTRKNLWGDGDCDAAFNCAEFSYDRWDCVDRPSYGIPSVKSCGINKIRDCNNFCNRKDWFGDGDCDFAFNCADLAYDYGDCNEYNHGNTSSTPPSTQKESKVCASDEINNCQNTCSSAILLGNGSCDTVFDCRQFSYDKGDCKKVSIEITSPNISSTDANTLRQCIDVKGNITFSDSPCPNESKEDWVIEKTLEQEAQEAATQGISKMSALVYQEAGEYFEQAISLLPIDSHHQILSEYLTLGGYAFHKALLYDKSIALYERALVIEEKLYGKEHPKIAMTLNNLALLYQAIGEYTQAKPLFERSLSMVKKFFEDDHPTVIHYSNAYNKLLSEIEKTVP